MTAAAPLSMLLKEAEAVGVLEQPLVEVEGGEVVRVVGWLQRWERVDHLSWAGCLRAECPS